MQSRMRVSRAYETVKALEWIRNKVPTIVGSKLVSYSTIMIFRRERALHATRDTVASQIRQS